MPSPVRSRAPSRTQSRAASPALSVKSRKSMMSSRQMGRNNYVEHELTDDEDSGSDGYVDDFRSLRGRRESSARSTASRRSRKNSTQSSLDLEDDSESFAHANSGRGGSSVRSNRDRRSGSIARSVQNNWSPAKQTNSTSTSSRSRDNGLLDRNDRTIKNVSDSPLTPDSESEPGTKALVQAKIREKLAQQSSLDESSSDFWKSKPNNNKINEKLPDKIDNIQAHTLVTAVEKIDFIDEPNTNESDDSPIGPPPSAPDHEWECEFCTFVNEPNIKICTICCKTPKSGPPKPAAASTTTGAVAVTTNNTIENHIDTITNKIDEEKNSIPSTKSKTASSSEENSKDTSTGNGCSQIKGRTRKISFWPGTKSK